MSFCLIVAVIEKTHEEIILRGNIGAGGGKPLVCATFVYPAA
jgi:hypothetical protein